MRILSDWIDTTLRLGAGVVDSGFDDQHLIYFPIRDYWTLTFKMREIYEGLPWS